jgi:acetolactate synthase-1/2/3 large subunit
MNPLPARQPAGGSCFSAPAKTPTGLAHYAQEPFVNNYLQPHHGQQISGAELIIRGLEQHGVRIVSGVPGGALLPLYEALGRSRLLRHILARHEQAAGFIAQGMARVTGRAGVCLATSGPGVTNIVTALADAKLDSVPLVCIAGQVPQHLIGTDAFQEVATLEMVRPITKACFFVKFAHETMDILAQAFHTAEQGRPGPVLIDVPKDVQMQAIPFRHSHPVWPHHGGHAIESVPAANPAAFDQAAALIAAADRPLFYLGGGVVKARAQALARQLAEHTGIPVTTTLMALGVLPSDHELNLGMLGMHGARYTNHAIEAADLLIAIGARFDDRATGNPQHFATQAKIIHIDIDPHELGKIKQPDLAIRDDAAAALRQLLERAHAFPSTQRARQPWHAYIRSLKASHPLLTPRDDEICSPYGIMRALGECLSKDTIITTDVGQHQMWAAQALPLHHADRWLTSGGLGTMGFGLPAAIGAALVLPESPVVCITGDGSLLMNIQEFATLAELRLNVKIILLDNAALGLVRQQQELFYQQRYTASRYQQPTDFVAIARAFGLHAHDLDKAHEPRELLQQVLATPGPSLIRVPIDEAEHVLPMVAPGKANTQPVDHDHRAALKPFTSWA